MNIRFAAVAFTAGLFALSSFDAAAEDFSAIESDPLAWLKADMSCADLTDQIKARYAPLGKFSDMPEKKKAELREVLAVVCSERFARCGFRSCGDGASANAAAPANADPALLSEIELTERAEARLRSIVADFERSRGIAISAAKKAEAQQKLAWQRIVMPEETAREKAAGGGEARPEPAPTAASRSASRPARKGDAGKTSGKKKSPPVSFSY